MGGHFTQSLPVALVGEDGRTADEFPTGTRIYSPVTGTGSPLAPPMRVTPADDA
ncbi:hypothetical protein ACFV2H_36685 [Streptomyces sp. NPDC059629]|uniref:hypothetical protein n=1 Tax=Streptomyces sp. NPDC059629 TaxID=3346889 RepID=UPI00369B16C5